MKEKEKKAMSNLKELSHYCSLKMLDMEDKNSDIWANFVIDIQIIKNLIEKQEEIINKMAKYITENDVDNYFCKKCKYRNIECTMEQCIEHIIKYFIEEEGE